MNGEIKEKTFKIGRWVITYPASCNGNTPNNRIAFLTPSGYQSSGFVSLYGNGEIGIETPCAPPARVIKKLRELSAAL